MKENNLLTLLKNLSPYEMNKLRKFIVSPYFNKSEKIITFFDALKADILKKKLKNKEHYYKLIYLNQSFNDQKFRNLNSDLFQLTLKFLAQEEYEKDHQSQANNLIISVKERDLKALFEKSISTAYKWMDKIYYQDGNTYLQKFNLEKNIFNLTTEFEKKTAIRKNERGLAVLKINDHLDYFYMIEKLKYYNSYLSWKKIVNVEYEFPYINRVLAIVKTHKTELPPALQIYFEMYKIAINDKNKEGYENLKKLIFKYSNLFRHEDNKEQYEALINYSVRQINVGNSEYYEDLLSIYNKGIDTEALLEKGQLSPTSFRNICFLSLRMQKIEWTENFINEKIHLVESQFRENAYKFNLSRLYFYKKEYNKVIETVREVEFNDPLYAYMSKTMIMLSYYELYDDEALSYFADSFATYMRRSKSSSEKVRRDYLNFIKYMKKMVRARYETKLYPNIKKELLQLSHIASKPWFLEKLKDVKLPNEE